MTISRENGSTFGFCSINPETGNTEELGQDVSTFAVVGTGGKNKRPSANLTEEIKNSVSPVIKKEA